MVERDAGMVCTTEHYSMAIVIHVGRQGRGRQDTAAQSADTTRCKVSATGQNAQQFCHLLCVVSYWHNTQLCQGTRLLNLQDSDTTTSQAVPAALSVNDRAAAAAMLNTPSRVHEKAPADRPE